MTPDQEKQLCRLLRLKRLEQPPPGYFNRFARQVMARIEAGEAAGRAPLTERILQEASWLRRLFGMFEARPALAGVMGALACAALISGIVFSERVDTAPVALSPQPSEFAEAAVGGLPSVHLAQPALPSTLVSSTNPVMPSGGTLFDLTHPLEVQPVSGHERN